MRPESDERHQHLGRYWDYANSPVVSAIDIGTLPKAGNASRFSQKGDLGVLGRERYLKLCYWSRSSVFKLC